MKTLIKTENHFYGKHKRHAIELRKDEKGQWYIIVNAPDGSYAYDGWWEDSYDKTVDEAIAEAIKGACLGLVQGEVKPAGTDSTSYQILDRSTGTKNDDDAIA